MKIRWNMPGFEDLRRSPKVEEALQAEVDNVLRRAGGETEGYAGGVEPGRTRSRGYVVTTTGESIRREARDHTLLRALGSGS